MTAPRHIFPAALAATAFLVGTQGAVADMVSKDLKSEKFWALIANSEPDCFDCRAERPDPVFWPVDGFQLQLIILEQEQWAKAGRKPESFDLSTPASDIFAFSHAKPLLYDATYPTPKIAHFTMGTPIYLPNDGRSRPEPKAAKAAIDKN